LGVAPHLKKRLSRVNRLNVLAAAGVLFAASLCGCAQAEATPGAASFEVPTITPPPAVPWETAANTPAGAAISGRVLAPDGVPVARATVRIQATANQTVTNDEGAFVLTGLEPGQPVTVSAWQDGYYCANQERVNPPAEDVTLTLRQVQTNDNPDYAWIPPSGDNSCYSCKPGVTQVWLDNDPHGRSAANLRFLSMYNGTDLSGNQSPPTRYGTNRDYGRIPLLPDLRQPYFGPGYKLDFPDNAGDFCHKLADVTLDPVTGLPYANMPGVLSQDIRRPFPEDRDRYQIFFGTFDDDNVPMEDTNLPLIQESAWCAPCHYGIFWDTLVYNSYGEWLASPYSDPETGKTCQQCHMPAPTILNGRPITNVAPGMGGVERDPLTIHAHTFPGGSSTDLLQEAVTMTGSATRFSDRIRIDVTLENDLTGHSVPTDSPLRQMILLVRATDSRGRELPQLDGSTIPEAGGVGDRARGYYAGLPGRIYAKTLMEVWTEVSPTGSYWNPTRLVEDTRLAAFASDASSYTFASQADGRVTIEVTLLYRRAHRELMDLKGWDTPDLVMETQVLVSE
jgi:hypothetical protein